MYLLTVQRLWVCSLMCVSGGTFAFVFLISAWSSQYHDHLCTFLSGYICKIMTLFFLCYCPSTCTCTCTCSHMHFFFFLCLQPCQLKVSCVTLLKTSKVCFCQSVSPLKCISGGKINEKFTNKNCSSR